MGYIAMFLMIGALIFVHELGHFIAAKLFGIGVKQFSVGFGKRLWGVDYKGTEYKVSVFPVGGYVMPDVEELEDYFRYSFRSRIAFSLAGPMANIVFAWVGVAIISVIENGFGFNSLFVKSTAGLYENVVAFVQSLPMVVSNPGQLSGIVGLVAIGGKAVQTNIMSLLSLGVLLNINLAFLNLLPMLPLDGGKIVLDILDKFRMPVRKAYVPVAIAGWVLILGLMLFVTYNDVAHLMA